MKINRIKNRTIYLVLYTLTFCKNTNFALTVSSGTKSINTNMENNIEEKRLSKGIIGRGEDNIKNFIKETSGNSEIEKKIDRQNEKITMILYMFFGFIISEVVRSLNFSYKNSVSNLIIFFTLIYVVLLYFGFLKELNRKDVEETGLKQEAMKQQKINELLVQANKINNHSEEDELKDKSVSSEIKSGFIN